MLLELTIENFAIIERVAVGFGPGLTVLTGETGAGKSIMVDALNALVGARTGAEVVRTGAASARIEGVFALPEDGSNARDAGPMEIDPLRAALAEAGIEADDGTLILAREIQRGGRSIGRVNGRAVPTSFLEQVGRQLVDLHAQSEHVSLARRPEQLNFLDRYAGVWALRGQVAERVGELRRVRREIEAVETQSRDAARRSDLLRYQINEIEAAALREGEEEDLVQERTILSNAEKLATLAADAYAALRESESGLAALDALGGAVSLLAELAAIDPSLEPVREAAEGALYQLEDQATAIRQYRDRVEFNPERLEQIEERLALVRTLQRKYGATVETVLDFQRQASEELAQIESSEERLAALRAEEDTLRGAIGRLAGELSQQRGEAAARLRTAVEGELADLSMARARFAIDLGRTPDPEGVPLAGGETVAFDATGVDRVEFLIAPNAGEPPKPLAKIASGGETSRIMLALKTVLSRADAIPTLIFDEVDAGIGGKTGQVVGEKLATLARRHQVVCVTHLPQIAVYGDQHLHVAKDDASGHTKTRVDPLVGEGRETEIALMLGGRLTEASRSNARDLLTAVERWREGDEETRGVKDAQVGRKERLVRT
jgi:DNA repair protein RecN (Recombination protein N)